MLDLDGAPSRTAAQRRAGRPAPPRTTPTANLWRAAVVVCAALACIQFAIEVSHAPRVLELGVRGASLFEGHTLRERGPATYVVDTLPAGSPLADQGVEPGDRLRFERPLGRFLAFAAGERATVEVLHQGNARTVEVTVPAATRLPPHAVGIYVTNALGSAASLILGVVIGLRRPDGTAMRALVASGLLNGWMFPYSAPAAAHVEWLDFLASMANDLGAAALVLFMLHYPDDRPSGWRARIARAYPWLFVLLTVAALVFYGRLYAGYYEPVAGWILRTSPVVLFAIFLCAVVLAWREAHGEWRTRLKWIMATIGTIMVVVLLGNLNAMTGYPLPAEDVVFALNIAVVAAEAAMVYAILRRRVFDFGFALNRTLVFGIVGAILLGAFQLVHGIVEQFLHFDDRNKALLLSAILSVAVYLSFSQLKQRVERLVDRVFFSAWAAKEEQLRNFVAEAKHATDADALSRLVVTAFDRFSDEAGCAVFRRQHENAYGLLATSLVGAPDVVFANDETLLALRAHGTACRMRGTMLPGFLAVPMSHRGELLGFVAVGARSDGESYRPDQVDAMHFAAREAGLDFYALDLARLTEQVESERRASETLRAQLHTAMALAERSR